MPPRIPLQMPPRSEDTSSAPNFPKLPSGSRSATERQTEFPFPRRPFTQPSGGPRTRGARPRRRARISPDVDTSRLASAQLRGPLPPLPPLRPSVAESGRFVPRRSRHHAHGASTPFRDLLEGTAALLTTVLFGLGWAAIELELDGPPQGVDSARSEYAAFVGQKVDAQFEAPIGATGSLDPVILWTTPSPNPTSRENSDTWQNTRPIPRMAQTQTSARGSEQVGRSSNR